MPPFTGTRSHTQVTRLPAAASETNTGTTAAIQAIRDLFARDTSETPVQETSAIFRQAWERLRESHERALRRIPGLKHFPFWVLDNLRRSTIERVILTGYNEDIGYLFCYAPTASERLGVERWELILYFGEFKQPKARLLATISKESPTLDIEDLYHGIRDCQQTRRSQNARLGPNPPPYYEFVKRDFEIYLQRGHNIFHPINHVVSVRQTDAAIDDEDDDDDENDFDSDKLPDGESDGEIDVESPDERLIMSSDDENEIELEHENSAERDERGGQEVNEGRDRQLSLQNIHENQRLNYYLEIQQMDNQDYLEDIDQTNDVEPASEGAIVGNPPLLQEAINLVDNLEPTVVARQATVATSVPTPPISIFDGASSEIDNVPPSAIGQDGGSISTRCGRANSATVDRESDYNDYYRAIKEERLTAERRCSSAERHFSFIEKREQSIKPLVTKLNDVSTAIESDEARLKEYKKGTKVILLDKWRQALERLHHTDPGAIEIVSTELSQGIDACVKGRGTKRRRDEMDLGEKKKRKARFLAEFREVKQRQQAHPAENTSAPSA